MRTVSAPELLLTPVDPADEQAVREWFELCGTVVRADRPGDPPPCWRRELGRLRDPVPGIEEAVWVARLGGSARPSEPAPASDGGLAPVVGAALLQLPVLDNLDNAAGEILVAPEFRRRGVGRALLAHLRTEALREGRVRLIAEVHHPLDPAAPDPGGRFAAASGAVCGLVETVRRLDLAGTDQAVLDSLAAQAGTRARGYSLVQWIGATPNQWLDDVAYLTGRMSIDSPLDGLQWGAEVYDADRLRGQEVQFMARGHMLVTTAAVDGAGDGNGTAVAFTRIICPQTPPWYAEQWETIVAPEHRGHRLGMLVKVANLNQVRTRYPRLRFIDTDNADSNSHMVAINEALRFRPHRRLGQWQLDLAVPPAVPPAGALRRRLCPRPVVRWAALATSPAVGATLGCGCGRVVPPMPAKRPWNV